NVLAVVFAIVQIALIEIRNFFSSPVEKQSQHLFQPIALEQFQAARAQARAFDKETPLLVQQSVVFHLVAEHGRVASIQLQINAFRKDLFQTCNEVIFFDSGANGLWRDEVNAVGIDFDNLRASFPEPCDGGLNQLSAFGRDLIGRVEIVEMAHLKTEV